MARVDLPEPYAVRFARQSIRDSLMSHGEEVVLLRVFHINEDYGVTPRCPDCYDEVYEQPERFDCDRCYGSTFEGGIKEVHRAWAIFTDSQDAENFSARGVYHPQPRTMHTEHIPDLWQRDFVARVTEWSLDHRPQGIEGIYVMKDVTNESLRTGNRAGQTSFDNVGQRCDLSRVDNAMPIYKYPLVGEVFERFDGNPR